MYVNGYEGDGYPDIISKYVNYGHNQLNGPFGGFVNSTILQNGNNNIFNYILNNDTFTYMTFYNNYSLTIGFTDESIVNTNGSDIFFNLYDQSNSHLQANVYVSNNESIFEFWVF